MRSKILNDTVILYNYIGEVRDKAIYQATVLMNCRAVISFEVRESTNGKKPNDNGVLYIFDRTVTAVSAEGEKRTFLPLEEWKNSDHKENFWTLRDDSKDYYETAYGDKIMVNSVTRRKAGRPRMWHYEVRGN